MTERNIVDKLAQLSDLKKAGALTDEEYAMAKAYILKNENENACSIETAIVPVIDEKLDPKYAENFSETGFWDKITGVLKKAGVELIYKALKLFYAAKNPNCPIAVKGTIYAALGYFILPFDLLPDVIPFVGFSDDLIALGAAIGIAHMYIDEWVIEQAQNKMVELFGKNILKNLD